MSYHVAELVPKSYMPLRLEKGMLFLLKDIDKEYGQLFPLEYDVPDALKEEFMQVSGAPVELYIISEDEEIIATPDVIGWIEYPGEEEYHSLSLQDINKIFEFSDGLIEVDIDGYIKFYENKLVPILFNGKCVIRMLTDEEEE